MALSITKPTVGSDAGTWGTILNTALDAIVTQIDLDTDAAAAAQATADAALAASGDSMTGELNILGIAADVIVAGSQSGPAYELDLALATGWTLTATGDITFSFTNETAGKMYGVALKIVNGGLHTLIWPASVKWAGGTAPTLTNGTDIVGLVTLDGGTSWVGGAQLDVS